MGTSSYLLLRSPTPVSSLQTRWSNATQDTESTWPVVSSTVEMSSPRMSTPPLPPSRPREPSSSSTGAQLVSRSVSTTSHQQSSPEVILPRSREPSACCLTPPLLLRPGLVLTISSILCTPSVPLSTGTSEREWRRESSLRPVRISLPLRRITKRLVSTLSKLRERKKERNTRNVF